MIVDDPTILALLNAALSGGADRVKWTAELKIILDNLTDSKINVDKIGAALGIAPLDASSRVPAANLPSYVDDVIEAADFASLPVSGETGKIYVTIDDNKQYRWSGSMYIDITPGGSFELDDLTDVVVTAPAIGDILVFDGTNWINAGLDLEDLDNVVITTPAIGDRLEWDGTNWINVTPSGGGGSIATLTDVDLTGLAIGDVLKWSGTEWIPDTDDDSEIGAAAPLSGSYAAAAGTVATGNTVEEAIEKLDGNIDLKENKSIGTTGSTIFFATPEVYNSPGSPSASNITDDLTGARIGVVQKIYHNKVTAPTFPAGWVLIGGSYSDNELNIIYAEWVSGTRVEYWITQEQ